MAQPRATTRCLVPFRFEPTLQIAQKETAGWGLGRWRRRTWVSCRGGARNEAVAAANPKNDGRAAGEGGASVRGHGRTGRLADEHVCRAPGESQPQRVLPPFAACRGRSLPLAPLLVGIHVIVCFFLLASCVPAVTPYCAVCFRGMLVVGEESVKETRVLMRQNPQDFSFKTSRSFSQKVTSERIEPTGRFRGAQRVGKIS